MGAFNAGDAKNSGLESFTGTTRRASPPPPATPQPEKTTKMADPKTVLQIELTAFNVRLTKLGKLEGTALLAAYTNELQMEYAVLRDKLTSAKIKTEELNDLFSAVVEKAEQAMIDQALGFKSSEMLNKAADIYPLAEWNSRVETIAKLDLKSKATIAARKELLDRITIITEHLAKAEKKVSVPPPATAPTPTPDPADEAKAKREKQEGDELVLVNTTVRNLGFPSGAKLSEPGSWVGVTVPQLKKIIGELPYLPINTERAKSHREAVVKLAKDELERQEAATRVEPPKPAVVPTPVSPAAHASPTAVTTPMPTAQDGLSKMDKIGVAVLSTVIAVAIGWAISISLKSASMSPGEAAAIHGQALMVLPLPQLAAAPAHARAPASAAIPTPPVASVPIVAPPIVVHPNLPTVTVVQPPQLVVTNMSWSCPAGRTCVAAGEWPGHVCNHNDPTQDLNCAMRYSLASGATIVTDQTEPSSGYGIDCRNLSNGQSRWSTPATLHGQTYPGRYDVQDCALILPIP